MSETGVLVPGTANFREVGAAVAGGYRLRPGYLFRSDALSRLGREGRAALTGLGVRRVVDLRSDRDRRLGGRDRPGADVEVVRVPMLGGSAASFLGGWELRDVYREILVGHGPEIRAAVRAVAGSPGPVVVHCTAGKDRTGIVIALVLLVLGADRDEVVADYAASEGRLAGEWTDRMVRRLRLMGVRPDARLRAMIGSSPAAVLRGELQWLDRERGGVAGYLASVGVGADDLDRLRATLLVPA